MTTLQVLGVLLLTAASAKGQSYHLGRCPESTVQEDFNAAKYMGTWYEIEKLPAWFQTGRCTQATYSLLSDGTVSVRNENILSDGTVASIQGTARVIDPSQPANLGVSFFKGVPDAPYTVVSTDYQSYALVYSCSDYFGLFYIDFAWILARSRALTDDITNQLHDKLTAIGVDVNRLKVSNQTACDGYNQ
ncbi:apolipoprotein D-like [Menidia menidia]